MSKLSGGCTFPYSPESWVWAWGTLLQGPASLSKHGRLQQPSVHLHQLKTILSATCTVIQVGKVVPHLSTFTRQKPVRTVLNAPYDVQRVAFFGLSSIPQFPVHLAARCRGSHHCPAVRGNRYAQGGDKKSKRGSPTLCTMH